MSGRGGTLEGLGGPVSMDSYRLDGIDPTLDACCQREVESNRRYNALTSTLKRHDIAALAERRRRNLVATPAFDGCRCCYDPNSDGHGEYRALTDYKIQHSLSRQIEEALEAEQQNEPNDIVSDEDEDSVDEFDYLLDDDLPGGGSSAGDGGPSLQELEDQRRAELEFEVLKRQVAVQHGYGTHRQMHPGRVLKAAGLAANPSRPPPPAVVLHLVDPDSVASASLDYYFETELAAKHPGTIFIRSSGRSTLLMDAAIAQKAFGNSRALHPDRDMPALVAIRDGAVANVCPRLQGLSYDEDGPIESQAVERWLEQSGVLRSQPPVYDALCYIRPEEEALMDYMATKKSSNEVAEDERYDCGLDGCSKAFRHEHVGIKTSEQDGLMVKEETILGTNDEE